MALLLSEQDLQTIAGILPAISLLDPIYEKISPEIKARAIKTLQDAAFICGAAVDDALHPVESKSETSNAVSETSGSTEAAEHEAPEHANAPEDEPVTADDIAPVRKWIK